MPLIENVSFVLRLQRQTNVFMQPKRKKKKLGKNGSENVNNNLATANFKDVSFFIRVGLHVTASNFLQLLSS